MQRSPLIPQAASTASPSGPHTVARRSRPPVPRTTAATVPFPPSAMGAGTTCAPGATAAMPRAMACAASGALRDSFSESGATVNFIAVTLEQKDAYSTGRDSFLHRISEPSGARVGRQAKS